MKKVILSILLFVITFILTFISYIFAVEVDATTTSNETSFIGTHMMKI